MPRADLTDITVVIDRSGSMDTCRADAQGGLNALIKEQKSQPGEAVFSLVQFDTAYEFVHKAVPIQSVPDYILRPRGSTALLDAVGRAITETGERLAAMDEKDRPGLVVFVIITDGAENASVEFTLDSVGNMIQTQQEVYKWQFQFLGANLAAFSGARALRIDPRTAAQYSEQKTSAAIKLSSRKISEARYQVRNDQAVSMHYTAEERESIS